MVRPSASDSNRKLGRLLAQVITVEVKGVLPTSTTVSRSGAGSITEILSVCFPDAVRENNRKGLTPIELFKDLEKIGFTRVRMRYLVKKDDSDSTMRCGCYRYGNRRLRDPDNLEDYKYLSEKWPFVNAASIGPKCSLETVVELLRQAIAVDKTNVAVAHKMKHSAFFTFAHVAASNVANKKQPSSSSNSPVEEAVSPEARSEQGTPSSESPELNMREENKEAHKQEHKQEIQQDRATSSADTTSPLLPPSSQLLPFSFSSSQRPILPLPELLRLALPASTFPPQPSPLSLPTLQFPILSPPPPPPPLFPSNSTASLQSVFGLCN